MPHINFNIKSKRKRRREFFANSQKYAWTFSKTNAKHTSIIFNTQFLLKMIQLFLFYCSIALVPFGRKIFMHSFVESKQIVHYKWHYNATFPFQNANIFSFYFHQSHKMCVKSHREFIVLGILSYAVT